MKKQQQPENDYLRTLEAKERSRKRTRILLAGSAVLAVGASALLLPQMMASGSKVRYESRFANELTQEKVQKILASDRSRLVIRYRDSEKRDTVFSYSDYLELIDQDAPVAAASVPDVPVTEAMTPEELDSLALSDGGLGDVIDFTQGGTAAEGQVVDASGSPERIYGFNMNGARLVGEELSLQIVNFDAAVKYDIDFGNGVRQSNVERLTRYAYPEAGSYFVKLIATEEGKPSRLHASAEVVISAPATVEEPLQAVAQNAASRNIPANLRAIQGIQAPNTSVSNTMDPSQIELPEKVATTNINKPLLVADKMPSFPGGKEAMNRFISQNIRYPYQRGDSKRVEGRTLATFVVGPNGEILQPKVMRSLGEAYDREVYRVINMMPSWEPGEVDGEKVAVYYQVMINFDLIED